MTRKVLARVEERRGQWEILSSKARHQTGVAREGRIGHSVLDGGRFEGGLGWESYALLSRQEARRELSAPGSGSKSASSCNPSCILFGQLHRAGTRRAASHGQSLAFAVFPRILHGRIKPRRRPSGSLQLAILNKIPPMQDTFKNQLVAQTQDDANS